jgi:alpha-glucosidase (family GH31 glycosyl hydrolase)
MIVLVTLFGLLIRSSAQSGFYQAQNIVYKASVISAVLQYQGQAPSNTITALNLTVISETFQRVRVRVTDLNKARWEVPDIVLPPSQLGTFATANYSVSIHNSPFGLTITRNSNNLVIFNIDPSSLFQYQNQDIILTSNLSYPINIYGIGERVTNFPLRPGTYTLFSRDAAGPYDDGQAPGKNMYSSQPMYVGLDSAGNAHGAFLLNSNAMDVSVSSNSITFRTIGGIIDLFVFVGPRPEDVVRQYQSLVGFPVLTPYWGLGYHQCRWGYHNLSDLQNVVNNFSTYQLPLDVMWTDIDYMFQYEDFTLDASRYNYAGMANFLNSLHQNGRRFVPIMDAGIASSNNSAYNLGSAMNVWIQSPNHPGALNGSVWPGPAVYIDWFHPNATSFWHSMMDSLHNIMSFDGFWTDMNEPSNFCDGECGYPPSPLVQNLPYTPGQTMINTKTIDLAGSHYSGILEYDVHNLYGFKMAQASASYFTQVKQTRPFVISRSSFPSHGRFASKWLGDNFSTFDWMGYSIPGMFNFQIFGIPLIGADICGFNWNTTEELCCRWYQLGTLYTFSRNHNSIESISQEPWAFGQNLLTVSNSAIRVKYSLINYYYTHMFAVSLQGGTVFRPTFFEFPSDIRLQADHSQDQFMIGNSLLVHPVLLQGATSVSAYFPAEIWYNWYSGKRIITPFNRTIILDAPLVGNINIHMRAGTIIPRNDGSSSSDTVEKLRLSNLTLVIAINAQGKAFGQLVLDDGVSLGTIEEGKYTFVQYFYVENDVAAELIINVMTSGYVKANGEWPYVSKLVLYGCLSPITSITSNGQQVNGSLQYYPSTQVAIAQINGIAPDQPNRLIINF